MRSLVPPLPGPPDLSAVYAPPRREWVRANVVAAVDGAADVAGTSRALSGPADQELLGLLRELADVVLVGAGTARAEGYRPLRLGAQRQARRQAAGRPAQPALAVVTGSGDPGLGPLPGAITGPRPIVITHGRAPRPPGEVDVDVVGEDAVDLPAALAGLRARGLGHVLCEGGPHLLSDLLAADLVDELCLTISPTVAGPGAGRLVEGTSWAAPRQARLAGLLEDGGTLFARYLLSTSARS